jgi:hypothetical protein
MVFNLIKNKTILKMTGGGREISIYELFILSLILFLIKIAFVNISYNVIVPKLRPESNKINYYDSTFLTILTQSLFL